MESKPAKMFYGDVCANRSLKKRYAEQSIASIRLHANACSVVLQEHAKKAFHNVDICLSDYTKSIVAVFMSSSIPDSFIRYRIEKNIYKLRKKCRDVWYILKNLDYHGLERKWFIQRYSAEIKQYATLQNELSELSIVEKNNPALAVFNNTLEEWTFLQNILFNFRISSKSLFQTEEQKRSDAILVDRFSTKGRKAKAQGEKAYFAFLDGMYSHVMPKHLINAVIANIKDEKKRR